MYNSLVASFDNKVEVYIHVLQQLIGMGYQRSCMVHKSEAVYKHTCRVPSYDDSLVAAVI